MTSRRPARSSHPKTTPAKVPAQILTATAEPAFPVTTIQTQAAQQAAEALLADARSRAQRLRQDVEHAAEGRRAEVEDAARIIEKEAQAAADALLSQAADDARQVTLDANTQAKQLLDDAQETARKLTAAARQAAAAQETARKDAQFALEEAKGLRARTLGHAQAEANAMTDQAREVLEAARRRTEDREAKKAHRGRLIDEWSPRVVLAGAIGLTASGEYQLATLAGWPPGLAWLLFVVLDVYVVQSLRRHRDVAIAIGLMVLANAVYHLAERGLFGVLVRGGQPVLDAHGEPRPEWWLIVGVAAIAPFVMWRIHRITAPAKVRKERRWRRGESAEAVLTPTGESTLTLTREDVTPGVGESAQPSQPALSPAVAQDSHSAPDESARESADESARESAGPARESAGESTRPTPNESAKPQASGRESNRRESARERARESSHGKPRESAPKVTSIGDEEAELVALMKTRGGAEAVTLTDAKRICASGSEATQSRRLKAARDTYTSLTA